MKRKAVSIAVIGVETVSVKWLEEEALMDGGGHLPLKLACVDGGDTGLLIFL